MTAVSVSIFNSYQKSKAIKVISEDIGFAMNSIAKDVRMGRIETTDSNCIGSAISNSPKNCLMVSRNRGGRVCYRISDDYKLLEINESITGASCSVPGYNKIIDLSSYNMSFNTATSGFYGAATDTTSATKSRGWVEINLNIENPSMETDSIRVQTIVSSRDYGW